MIEGTDFARFMDDAIVIAENNATQLRNGKGAMTASANGRRQR